MPHSVPSEESTESERKLRFQTSFAQQRLWFLDQFQPRNPAYNIPTATRLNGRLNVAVLEQALTEILRRHEVLRTVFPSHNGVPFQRIRAAEPVRLCVCDLRSLPESERAAAVEERWAAEHQFAFELSTGPLVRLSLLSLRDDEHILLMNMHHIIYDMWSHRVLLRELATLYNAFQTGRPSPLPELPVQYSDYAHWQRKSLASGVWNDQLDYWKEQLRPPLPALQLATDHSRPVRKTFSGATETLSFPMELTNALRKLSQNEGATFYMLLIAVFSTLLHRYSGQTDLIVGSLISNRDRVEVEPLIGLFINTLVLRTNFSGDPSFRELLRQVRDRALSAYDRHDVPFERLVEELQPNRHLSHDPLFQVVFDLQTGSDDYCEADGLSFVPLEIETRTAKFDLTLLMKDKPGGLSAMMEYNTDLFEAETIRRMLRHYQTLLEAIVADPTRQVSQLPLLTPVERRQILVDWNNTATEYPQKSIAEVFEQQVQAHPEAIAVVFEVPKRADEPNRRTRLLTPTLSSVEEEREKTSRSAVHGCNARTASSGNSLNEPGVGTRSTASVEDPESKNSDAVERVPTLGLQQENGRGAVTYVELNARANQLARYLQKRGVGAEEPVGLCVERSVEMIVGMLGILKAGGAYVPLDPDYPKERLMWMLEDAGIKVLVTQQNLQEVVGMRKGSPPGEDVFGTPDEADAMVGLTFPSPSPQPSPLGRGRTNRSGTDKLNALGVPTTEKAIPSPRGEGQGEGKGTELPASASDLTRFDNVHSHPGESGLREIICVDEQWQEISQELTGDLLPQSGPDSLAYVIYTSGSTGRPKGALIPQRGVVRLVKNANYFSVRSDDVFLQFAPMSFDASTFEIWAPLLNGAHLALMPPGEASLAELGSAIRRFGVTTLWLTAGLFHLMVDERLGDLQPLRQMLAGGDVLSPSHVQRFLEGIRDCRFLNGYGPTENTTFTSVHEAKLEEMSNGSIPIGRPISNTRIYLLDSQRQLVPAGVPGELYIGGAGLARGYLNDPVRTEEKFIPDPFSNEPKGRLYRTGDLARYRSDGTIEFLGRQDHQVKIRGFRIELGEIETLLGAHPAVRDAAVTAYGDGTQKRLVAYWVPRTEPALPNAELRAYLEAKLPDFMVPSQFVALKSLPLNPNGKVDRDALPLPEATLDRNARTEPRNPVEVALAEIWQEVLSLEAVGIHDDFFELGGHSLLATQMIARIDKIIGVRLPLRTLFEARTIAGLAAHIADQPASALPAFTSIPRRANRGQPSSPSPLARPVPESPIAH